MVLAVPFECSAARWYEDYEKAVDLIGDGECSREALQLLGAAVVAKKKPRLNARTIAVKTVDYVPYYQLARAHLACREIDSVRHYIEISRDRGVASSHLLDALEYQLSEIKSPTPVAAESVIDPEELAALVKEGNETIRRAISVSERVNSKKGTGWLAGFFTENQSRLGQANNDLSAAQELLSNGTLKRDLSAIEDATDIARQSLTALTDIEAEINDINAPEPTPEPVVARRVASATPTSAPPSRPTRVVAPSQSPTPRPIRPSSSDTPSRSREVPETLRRAAADYLTAGYDEVIRELEPSEYTMVDQQAAAYLLRAASHFAIYCLGGRGDEKRKEQIRWDISLLNDLDPSLRPDPLFFSPEFIELIGNFD